MSTGRIDVIATPNDDDHIYVSLEALERIGEVHPPDDDHDGFVVNITLTIEEARYLADELAGALEVHDKT